MAKTFDDYESTDRDKARKEHESIAERVNVALDRTEILQDVARRVTAFVEAYEASWDYELKHIAATRSADGYDPESHRGRIARNMELDLQIIRAAPATPDNARLFLDDVKILLAQFPQKDF